MDRRAQALRHRATPAEIRFWRLLHPIRQAGWHWRKQAPIGPYVVDFACHGARLVVEIDGDSHYTAPGRRHDAVRTAFLVGEGYRVLRFSNRDVMETGEGVSVTVSQALESSPPLRRK